jgi:hypothetical protein
MRATHSHLVCIEALSRHARVPFYVGAIQTAEEASALDLLVGTPGHPVPCRHSP